MLGEVYSPGMARLIIACAIFGLLNGVSIQSQSPAVSGAALYGEACATCHGADARGLNGPNLVALVAAKRPDDRLLQTMRNGVPGSLMPPSTASDAELLAILGYLKALASPPPASAVYGRPNPNADAITL